MPEWEQMSWEGTPGDAELKGSSGHATCSSGLIAQGSALDTSTWHKARPEQTSGSDRGQPLLLHPDPSR